MDLVSIPDGPYQAHVPDIQPCEYSDIEDTELYEAALDSRIDHPSSHVGQGDVWFKHVDDVAFCGLWEPGNRPGTHRFAPVFTMPAHRGRGIGRAMVLRRFEYARDRPDIDRMDTYAHNPGFFEQLGFAVEQHWPDKGTYYLSYTKS